MPHKNPVDRRAYRKRKRLENLEEARAYGRKANRRYRAAHPEKAEGARVAAKLRRMSNLEEARRRGREREAKWRKENPEEAKRKSRESGARWRVANPERSRIYNRRYYISHAEEIRIGSKQWRMGHPERTRAHSINRRLSKVNRTPPWAKELMRGFMPKILKRRNKLTSDTGVSYVIDHIVPLRGKLVSGLHVPWNLRVIPYQRNSEKGNKFKPVVIRYKTKRGGSPCGG